MQVRAVRQLHLRGLRQRPGRAALAIAAVGAGVALAVGVVITSTSLERSIGSFSASIAGPATLRVEGTVDRGGLDASTLPRVAAADGVQAAVPLVLGVVESVDRAGETSYIPVLGVTCEIEALIGDVGCRGHDLASLDGPLIGPGVLSRLGREGAIHTDLGSRPIGDAPVLEPLAGINEGVVVVYELALAQQELARPDALDAILVVPEPGADPAAVRRAVEVAAGAHNRVVDADTNLAESLVANLVLPVLMMFAVIGLVIGAQLVRNVLELTLEERRRELATASALGAAPRDVLTGILAEAATLGVLGGIVGIGIGVVVAHGIVGSFSDQVERAATGVQISVAVSPVAIVIGVAIALGVCVVAALGPARRAARRDLTAELSERARYAPPEPRTRRTTLIGTFVGLAAGLLLAERAHRDGSIGQWQQPAMLVSIVCTSLLVFRVPGLLVGPLMRAVGRLRPFATGPARVAVDDLLAAPRRTSSIAVAVGAPVILAASLSGIVPAMATGAERLVRQTSEDRVYASTIGTNNMSSVDSKLPPALEAEIAALPGVDRLERWYYANINHPVHGPFALDAMDGRAPRYHVHRGRDPQEVLDAGQAMIGTGLARARGLRVGDVITIPGRYGDVAVTVGGIWSSPNSIGRSVTLTGDRMREITGLRSPEFVQVVPGARVTAAELAERIRAADLDDRLIVLDPEELADDNYRQFSAIAQPFRAMQRGVLGVALVATASTLLLSSIQRRREMAVLAALGMAPADLARSTLIGTVVAALASGAIAVVASQAMVIAFSWASEVVTALHIPYEPRVDGLPLAIFTATFVALVGAVLPAWHATRADPVVALREA